MAGAASVIGTMLSNAGKAITKNAPKPELVKPPESGANASSAGPNASYAAARQARTDSN
jgi:hypothetical protein